MIRRLELAVDAAPGGHTNAYLLGDPPLLVDPAVPVGELPVDPARFEHVAVTHTHPDHVGGLRSIQTETDASIWALESHTDRFLERTGVEPDRTFREGDEVGSTGVTAYYTPGHTPDHVVFEHRDEAIVGDLAMAEGSVMVGAPDGEMRAYLSSLRRLRVRGYGTVHPGHGPAISEPTTRFAALIAHRLDREARVEAAVRNGASEVSAIVDAAYEKDLSGVQTLAEQTVVAHLEKLAVEGRITWDGKVAKPSPSS